MTGDSNAHDTLHNGPEITGEIRCIELGSGTLVVSKETDGRWRLITLSANPNDQLAGLAGLAEYQPSIRCIDVSNLSSPAIEPWVHENEDGIRLLWRESLMQIPQQWLKQPLPFPFPHKLILSKNGYHPIRPKAQQGELYRRYIPELKQDITLIGFDLDRHLDNFHRWQNNKRVAESWQQSGTREEHAAYLKDQLANNKNQLLIVCLDNEPFAYAETYWAKEDRIASYYAADDYDRGFHMLVGEEHHRGANKVAAWLPSICHFLYLCDPRTGKIVGEPRIDNQKIIGYLQQYGFAKIKQFDFPHKRAALMSQLRDTFFSDYF